MQLHIDPEFEAKIPPLTEDEFRQLEENILECGELVSPIIVWRGIIVDGHNRYRIIQKIIIIGTKSSDMIFAGAAFITST